MTEPYPASTASLAAPPQYSDDGKWWWDGRQWLSAPSPPPPPGVREPFSQGYGRSESSQPVPQARPAGDESIVCRTGLHWFSCYGASAFIVGFGFVLTLAAMAVGSPGSIGLFIMFLVVAAIVAVPGYVRFKNTEVVLTDQRISAKMGAFNRRSMETLLWRIEGLSVRENILGSALGFGTLVVRGVGGSPESLAGIRQPHELKRALDEQLSRHR